MPMALHESFDFNGLDIADIDDELTNQVSNQMMYRQTQKDRNIGFLKLIKYKFGTSFWRKLTQNSNSKGYKEYGSNGEILVIDRGLAVDARQPVYLELQEFAKRNFGGVSDVLKAYRWDSIEFADAAPTSDDEKTAKDNMFNDELHQVVYQRADTNICVLAEWMSGRHRAFVNLRFFMSRKDYEAEMDECAQLLKKIR